MNNAMHRTTFGHWSDSRRTHSDSREGPVERFLELDDEHMRSSKGNFPMAAVATVVVLLPLLMVGVGALAVFLIRT